MYGGHYSHAGIWGCSNIFIVGRLIFSFLGLIYFPRTTLTDTMLFIFSFQTAPFKNERGNYQISWPHHRMGHHSLFGLHQDDAAET